MLFLLHTPRVEGEGKEIFLYVSWRTDRSTQPLQPLLTLLKRGELAPVKTHDIDCISD